MHPIALKIRCVHYHFSANGWQQRNWDGGKEKKHTLSWSEETVTTDTTSICTCTWTSHHSQEKEKEHPSQTDINAIWAKIWSKHVRPFRRKEGKKKGLEDTLPFATVVVNVPAKSLSERGVQLLFWASGQLGALAYGRRSTVTVLSSHVKKSHFSFFIFTR